MLCNHPPNPSPELSHPPKLKPVKQQPPLLPASLSICSAFCLRQRKFQTIISLSLDIFLAEVWGLGGREGLGDIGGEGEARMPCTELEALGWGDGWG